ncbi:MAG: hypothetical protein ACI95C_000616 [Pseudohongiellaceae bacterium]
MLPLAGSSAGLLVNFNLFFAVTNEMGFWCWCRQLNLTSRIFRAMFTSSCSKIAALLQQASVHCSIAPALWDVNRLDAVSGSIELDKFADLIMLDQIIFVIEPELISDS